MRRVVSIVMLFLIGLSMVPLMRSGIVKSSGEVLDTVVVDSINGSIHYSSIVLQAGVWYQFLASGTYYFATGVSYSNQADAAYSTPDGWQTYSYMPYGGLYIAGLDNKPWGSYNSGHEYSCYFEGDGFQVGFWINDSFYPDNAGDLTVQIFLASQSSTSIVCSPNPVPAGFAVICSARVSGSEPTGTITWSTNSSTGNFSQTVCTLTSETCLTTYTDTSVGSVTITASYSGDSNNAPSDDNVTLTVFAQTGVSGGGRMPYCD